MEFKDFLDPRGHKEFRGFKDLWADRRGRMELPDRKGWQEQMEFRGFLEQPGHKVYREFKEQRPLSPDRLGCVERMESLELTGRPDPPDKRRM
jgi:hypothetical protein